MTIMFLVAGLVIVVSALLANDDYISNEGRGLIIFGGMSIIFITMMVSAVPHAIPDRVDSYAECLTMLQDETVEDRLVLCEEYKKDNKELNTRENKYEN